MYPSGATRILANDCLCEIALYKSNLACWSSTKQTSLSCSRHDITGRNIYLALTNTHSVPSSGYVVLKMNNTRLNPRYVLSYTRCEIKTTCHSSGYI